MHSRSKTTEIYSVFVSPYNYLKPKGNKSLEKRTLSEIGRASDFVVSDPELLLRKRASLMTEMKTYFLAFPVMHFTQKITLLHINSC